MKMSMTLWGSLVLFAASSSSSVSAGQTFVETFTGGSNQGGWTYGPANETIESSGGNPGAYLHEPLVDTYAPQPHTALGTTSVFTGDYRAHRVESFGVDLIVISAQFFTNPPLTLMLGNDNGTPLDTSDDCVVYLVGANVAAPGAGWTSYTFAIPSQSTTLPSGWQTYNACSTPDASWNNVITNVSYVKLLYGDPTFFYPVGPWNTGIDNPRITIELGNAYCFGDGSGTPCPCNNDSTTATGCKNSTGGGASIDAFGSASVAADDLVLVASGMPPHVSVFLFQGTLQANGGAGTMLGDGLLCAGGALKRFPVHAADGAGSASWGPGLSAFGGWTAGATRNFQAWYRNNGGPCGSGFNLSSARSISFTP
jgi:hypothetical protein